MRHGLCPSCGAAVNVPADRTETKCQYCDTTVTLQQAEAQFNEVKNSKFGGTLLIAETAQEGGSYAEALNYYNKVIEQQPDFADAWLNKGICMVQSSKIGDLKIPEAISSWKAAIKFAKNPHAMKKRVATEINNTVSDFYPVLERHYLEFHNLDDSLSEHGNRFILLESALSFAMELNPNATIARNGISLCDRFVASIKKAADSNANDAAARLFQKDWKGALTSATTAGSKENIANDLKRKLQETKSKYEKMLAKFDSEYARQITIRDAKETGSSAQMRGCGCLVIAILFFIVMLISSIYDYNHTNPEGERFFDSTDMIMFLLAGGLVVIAIRLYNKKQNQRNKDWLKKLPACFGTADLRLALHPTEKERFYNLLGKALSAGFSAAEIRSEVEKYLKERGCATQHIQEQLRHFDLIANDCKL